MIEVEHEVRLHLLRRMERKRREEVLFEGRRRRTDVSWRWTLRREKKRRDGKVWNLADFLHERFYHTLIHKCHAIQNREENDVSPVAKRFEKTKTALIFSNIFGVMLRLSIRRNVYCDRGGKRTDRVHEIVITSSSSFQTLPFISLVLPINRLVLNSRHLSVLWIERRVWEALIYPRRLWMERDIKGSRPLV